MQGAEDTSVAEAAATLAEAVGPPDSAQAAIPTPARTYRRPFTYSAERAARPSPPLPLALLKIRPR
jgi:hypothetical protein